MTMSASATAAAIAPSFTASEAVPRSDGRAIRPERSVRGRTGWSRMIMRLRKGRAVALESAN
jgi:hypothetical protein